MHIFSTTPEDTNDHTMMSLSLSDGLYCPMNRLESEEYIKKWKEIPKQNEQNLMLGKLYCTKIENIVKRLQSQNIVVCVFKTTERTTSLYLAATTKDNSLILAELSILHSNFLYGKMKYKTQNNFKENQFENFIAMLITDIDEEENEDAVCR